MEKACLVIVVPKFLRAVGDAPQAEHRDIETLAGPEHGEGFHIDHVSDIVVDIAGNDVTAGGKPCCRKAGRGSLQPDIDWVVLKGCDAFRNTERGGIHIAP